MFVERISVATRWRSSASATAPRSSTRRRSPMVGSSRRGSFLKPWRPWKMDPVPNRVTIIQPFWKSPTQPLFRIIESLNSGRGILRFKPSSIQNPVKLAASSTNHTPDFDSNFSNHNSSYTITGLIKKTTTRIGILMILLSTNPLIHPGYKNHKSSPFTDGVRIKRSNPSHHEPAHLGPTRKYSKIVHEYEADEDGEVWVKVPRNTIFFSRDHQNGNSWNGTK